ncbi:MAG: TIM barrel protein [Roseibium sp.]
MTKFSANLGFLWTDISLPEAIHAAKAARFDAVECHFPFDVDPAEVKEALQTTGLPMLGLNTRRGNVSAGDFGLAALPDRVPEARAAIDEAVIYADAINCAAIHVMAGLAKGVEAEACFIENLRYASEKAAHQGRTILIEPINHYDAPTYFLKTTDQAVDIITRVDADNLKLMFDCYHVQLMEGDLSNRLKRLFPQIGHIQFAAVPDRGAPDHGEVNYRHIFKLIDDLGYTHPLGAEYKPNGPTENTLSWLQNFS